jgi:hypothetical protein
MPVLLQILQRPIALSGIDDDLQIGSPLVVAEDPTEEAARAYSA